MSDAGDEDASRAVRYEFRRAVAFTAVFEFWTDLGLPEEMVLDLLEPHQDTITRYVKKYDLEPVLDENPVAVIDHDLEAMGILEFESLKEYTELVREFYDENPDALPLVLELEEVVVGDQEAEQ